MGAGERIKGNRYMVSICRVLSAWWCDTPDGLRADDLPFRMRSTAIQPVEGHWEGAGDILHRPDLRPEFPFSVECKKQEKGQMDSILEAPNWPVWAWWRQAKAQAKKTRHVPLLLFTRNRRKDYALLSRRAADHLDIRPHEAPVLQVARPDGEELTLCLLDDLVQVPPRKVTALRTALGLTDARRNSRARRSSRRSRKSAG